MAGSGRGPKYGNRKTVYQGVEFDSVLERDRWIVLREAEAEGRITGLRRQVSFPLLEPVTELREVTVKPGRVRTVRRTVLRGYSYVADFVYQKAGSWVVEDSKGYRTDVYRLKRAMMYDKHKILIREITRAGEEV